MTTETVSMNFSASPGLYQLADDQNALGVIDQLTARQSQLEALLLVATLDDEVLPRMNAQGRADYLSACLSASREIGELTKLLADRALKA